MRHDIYAKTSEPPYLSPHFTDEKHAGNRTLLQAVLPSPDRAGFRWHGMQVAQRASVTNFFLPLAPIPKPSAARFTRRLWPLLLLIGACSGESAPDPGAVPDVPSEEDPGTDVTLSAPAAVGAITQELQVVNEMTADELRTEHSLQFVDELGYDPLEAEGLDAIVDSMFGPNFPTDGLANTGFVIDKQSRYPSFAMGYAEIYMADLPVFVSTDMVLEALYRSHDKILQALEKQSLRPRLEKLLSELREQLIADVDSLPAESASDLNFYLGVALSLLDNGRVDPREPEGVKEFVKAAMSAAGEQQRVLFGVERRIDFSQFKPRGHYAGDAALESYFRAMIWLGRIDFRLIETQENGKQILRRRQVEAMLALEKLMQPLMDNYSAIDDTITAFVGEHDYMTLTQVDGLRKTLGSPDELDDVDDVTLASALLEGEFGEQRIASHIIRRVPGSDTFPLNLSFALFGQRYTVDSHVFSNVVYDRIPTRVVPNPLDVAFGALGNDQALQLLGSELDDEAGFAGALGGIRFLVDEHPAEYWESSIYTGWLGALRALSPASGAPPSDVPAVAQTEAWGRRLLNTQLSSWAQLRHNNVLYVKQSYTSGAACEYPDAYVDPYPEFFQAITHLAERAQQLIETLELDPGLDKPVQTYFANVARINTTLGEMAELQKSGMPHSDEHIAFINQAVTTNINCDGTILGFDGWYRDLHYEPLQAVEMDPVITDVHTDPGGPQPVAREASVLHVGTGLPRLMVMTVESCMGPRAYAGMVSSFQQHKEAGLNRLTDEEWKTQVFDDLPEVPWLEPILSK